MLLFVPFPFSGQRKTSRWWFQFPGDPGDFCVRIDPCSNHLRPLALTCGLLAVRVGLDVFVFGSFVGSFVFSLSPCQSVGRSVGRSISQSVNQSISQSVNQSISQSVNQSVSQSVRQSVSQSVIKVFLCV